MSIKRYSYKEKTRIGHKIAWELGMKKNMGEGGGLETLPTCYETPWGLKTGKEIFERIRLLGRKIENRNI
jgi:hypothetical protein